MGVNQINGVGSAQIKWWMRLLYGIHSKNMSPYLVNLNLWAYSTFYFWNCELVIFGTFQNFSSYHISRAHTTWQDDDDDDCRVSQINFILNCLILLLQELWYRSLEATMPTFQSLLDHFLHSYISGLHCWFSCQQETPSQRWPSLNICSSPPGLTVNRRTRLWHSWHVSLPVFWWVSRFSLLWHCGGFSVL